MVRYQVLVTELHILTVDGPVCLVGGLISPSDVLLRSAFLGELHVKASESHLTWRYFIVRQENTEDWVEALLILIALLQLSNESWNTVLKWISVLVVLTWGWGKTNEARTSQGTEIGRLDDCQERESVKALFITFSEASSILGWMSHNLTFSISQSLSSFDILLELTGF